MSAEIDDSPCLVKQHVRNSDEFPANRGYMVFFLLNDPQNPPADPITVEQVRLGHKRITQLWPVITRLDDRENRNKFEYREDMIQKEAFWKSGN